VGVLLLCLLRAAGLLQVRHPEPPGLDLCHSLGARLPSPRFHRLPAPGVSRGEASLALLQTSPPLLAPGCLWFQVGCLKCETLNPLGWAVTALSCIIWWPPALGVCLFPGSTM